MYSTPVTQTLLRIRSPGEYNFFFLMPRPLPRPIKSKFLWVGLRHMCFKAPRRLQCSAELWTYHLHRHPELPSRSELQSPGVVIYLLMHPIGVPSFPCLTSPFVSRNFLGSPPGTLLILNSGFRICFCGYQRKLRSGKVKHLAKSLTARTWQSQRL